MEQKDIIFIVIIIALLMVAHYYKNKNVNIIVPIKNKKMNKQNIVNNINRTESKPYELYIGAQNYMADNPHNNTVEHSEGYGEPSGIVSDLADEYEGTMENGLLKEDNILGDSIPTRTSEGCFNKKIKYGDTSACAMGSCNLPPTVSDRFVTNRQIRY